MWSFKKKDNLHFVTKLDICTSSTNHEEFLPRGNYMPPLLLDEFRAFKKNPQVAHYFRTFVFGQ